MKEANLLISRDYSVKIGDFGISIKLDPKEDPNEEVYELKGVTAGYAMKSFEDSIRNGEDLTLSKNKLLKNDYFALFATFTKVSEKCQQ